MKNIKFFWIILLTTMMGSSSCLLDNETENLPTLLTLLEQNDQFSIFLEGCERIDLLAQLDGGLNLTIFAPTNFAFEEFFRANGYPSINDVPEAFLDQLISYHIQLGVASISNIAPAYYSTPTTAGFDSTSLAILIDRVNGDLVFNNTANIVASDIQGKNGYIHGLDKVLSFPKILDLFTEERNSIFYEALERTGYLAQLQDNEAYTVFVPTDDVFEAYFSSNDGFDSLDDWSPERLREIVAYHIVEGNLSAGEFDGTNVETISDNKTINVVQFNNGLAINQLITTLSINVQGTNGVIHFIDGILLPD